MTYYMRVGDVPRKRHLWHRDAEGNRLPEELMGEEGFSGASSLLYHRHSPSAITGVEAVDPPREALTPNNPLLPWHLKAADLEPGADLVTGRRVLLGNDSVSLCWAEAGGTSPLYRNAAGDELVYVQSGRAILESVFGRIEVGGRRLCADPHLDDPPLGRARRRAEARCGPS